FAQFDGLAQFPQTLGKQRDLLTSRFGLVQVIALCVQLPHLRFRLGTEFLQLRQGADIPTYQEFHLLDPFVWLADFLPHGRRWMPWLAAETTQHIQFPIIENAQAFELARFLIGPMQPGMTDVWFDGVGFLRIEDALFDGLRGILLSQGFETHKAFFARWAQSGI